MDAQFVKKCTEEHNEYRSKVKPGASNMYFMSWDAGLAKTARAWSKTCSSKHNPHLKRKGEAHPIFETVGENIYVISGNFTIKDAVKAWYDEEKYYNFDDNKCNKKNMCERYTQLVWGETYKLGCAANYCPKGIKGSKIEKDGSVFVCNYSPRQQAQVLGIVTVEIVKDSHRTVKEHLVQLVVRIFVGKTYAVNRIVKEFPNTLNGIQTLGQPPFYCQTAF
ncbi:glioma pathogenesis-related protein 1-like [Chiloscyllium punctatum]|uniref:glioma pathogenesis-related protein 1-like n=1 Tax=Chiloscyllium punctatum TaxID=137246 RepID=UPI003B63DE57